MKVSSLIQSLTLGLVLGAGLAQAARANELDTIKHRGTLIVGVKADYPPFGFRAPDGSIVGIEPSLAAQAARKLGVKVEYVPVNASNRMQFLEQGKIDLLIATMNVTPERAKEVWFVEPYYYASGYNVLLSDKVKAHQWSDLKGQAVCGIQGTYYNKDSEQKYGVHIVAFTGTAEALTALKQGRCIGFIFDNTFIQGKLLDKEWSGYGMPLETLDAKPWGMATRLGDKDFHAFMDEMSLDWAKTGEVLKLETRFGITQHSAYVEKLHEQYKSKSGS